MKKVLALLLCVVMMFGCFVGCGNQGKDGKETVKIGVLVQDATGAEALAFKGYYVDYIAENYDVEFIYSDAISEATEETAAIDNFIANGCKAVISFSDCDRVAAIEQCASAKVYYAVATGVLTQEQYEQVKDNEYYVGAIGPSNDVEFQTGYEMAEYYINNGYTEFGMFGGAIPYYNEMHIYRAAGMITAMVDNGGEDASYLGATEKEEIIGKIYETVSVEETEIGTNEIVGYVGGYEYDDAMFGKIAEIAANPELEVVLTVGSGLDVFGAALAETDVKLATFEAYTDTFGEAMEKGQLDYLAGKFASSIGPIFIATLRAVDGDAIRDDDGNAIALGQGFWNATSSEEFETYATADTTDSPAYTAEILNTMMDADYDKFAEFVESYSFEEIKALQQ